MQSDDFDLIRETQAVLVQSWHVQPVSVRPEDLTWQLLREELAERILDLLKYKPNKLLTALYVLDISERRYAQAMEQPTMDDRAWDLAQAILERESQKIESRKRYAQPPREGIEDQR